MRGSESARAEGVGDRRGWGVPARGRLIASGVRVFGSLRRYVFGLMVGFGLLWTLGIAPPHAWGAERSGGTASGGAATVGALAVAETHPAQRLADSVRNHLWTRGYRCATRDRLLVVPGWRHLESPFFGAVAEQRYDGSIIVNRETLRDSKRIRVRGGWRYDADVVDTMIHEYLHVCTEHDRPAIDVEEAVVTYAADIETRAWCRRNRLRRCTPQGLMPYADEREEIDQVLPFRTRRRLTIFRRWLNGTDEQRERIIDVA